MGNEIKGTEAAEMGNLRACDCSLHNWFQVDL